jgi:hypothetical protein
MKTRKLSLELSMDGVEIIRFIEDNSNIKWNDICDLAQEFELYGDEGRYGYISFMKDSTKMYNPTENRVMMQEWVNKFFEAHKLDKKTSIQTVFTD